MAKKNLKKKIPKKTQKRAKKSAKKPPGMPQGHIVKADAFAAFKTWKILPRAMYRNLPTLDQVKLGSRRSSSG